MRTIRAKAFYAMLALSLVCSVLCAVLWSLRWPLVGDASLMHYVVFLMTKGMKPYRDIADINLPGSYFFEALGMRAFGSGALGWRLYDLSLLVSAGVATRVISQCKPCFVTLFVTG